ncbi:Respiratory supercomplex factor 1, mitochondrial [Malassezia cuniculi]|uniref:Respiratory supercomplex factor 1, mitochondrial n=1 Tax=Malassezia cuniculi TaxID=948313 RepID=A0AAF0EZD7_9BASI|nr:Respiratory supercomplex factor 1, mitochondrial [Malassezia cuniculi]
MDSEELPESGVQKLWTKLKRDPLVPLGSLATCGALMYATYYMRQGNRDNFQKALRWRIVFQGVTVVAAAVSLYYYRPAPRTADGVPLHWNHETNERKAAMKEVEWKERFAAAQARRDAEDAAIRKMVEREIAAREAAEAKNAPAETKSAPEPQQSSSEAILARIGQDKRRFTFS